MAMSVTLIEVIISQHVCAPKHQGVRVRRKYTQQLYEWLPRNERVRE